MAMNFKTNLIPDEDDTYSIGQDADADNSVPQKHWKFFGRFFGTANKVEHTLTIGSTTFDGSADVTIPVYSGSST